MFSRTVPTEQEHLNLCRNSEEFQSFISDIRANPCSNQYIIKLHNHRGKVSPILAKCIAQHGYVISEITDGSGVDKELHNGRVESVPCTWLTVEPKFSGN